MVTRFVDIRTIQEANDAFNSYIKKRSASFKSKGFHSRWYGMQFDSINRRAIINLKGVENYFTPSGFNIFAAILYSVVTGTSKSIAIGELSVSSSTFSYVDGNSHTVTFGSQTSTNGVLMAAGTDTTTPTTLQSSPTLVDETARVPITTPIWLNEAENYPQWGGISFSGTFNAGTLGSTGTFTNIGEMGLGIVGGSFTPPMPLFDRLATADGTFTTVNVNNNDAQAFTDTWTVTY
jgi:hypothetical protein